MVICELETILSEKHLSITQLSKETGVAYGTIYSLIKGTAKGVSYNTLNKLCLFLCVKPGDIIKFYSKHKPI